MVTKEIQATAELQVIGALINNHGAYLRVEEFLTPDLFLRRESRDLIAYFAELSGKGKIWDMIIIMGRYPQYIHFITDASQIITSDGYIEGHLRILAMYRNEQLVNEYSQKIVEGTADPDELQTVISECIDKMKRLDENDTISMKAAVERFKEHVEKNFKGEMPDAIKTGIPVIDELNGGGMHETDFVVLAARTSQGKSALALDIALNAICNAYTPTYFVSMEMGITQLVSRIVAHSTEKTSSQMLYDKMSYNDFEDVYNTANNYKDYPVYFSEVEGMTPELLYSKIKKNVKQYGIRFVIIDYIQILSKSKKGNDSETRYLGDISRMLKDLAKSLNICILALSQLNRNNSYEEPTLADIRSSGEIAEAADMVISLYRPEAIPDYPHVDYHDGTDISINGTAKVTVLKNRNGVSSRSNFMLFDAPHMHFYRGKLPRATSAASIGEERAFIQDSEEDELF